MGSGYIQEHYFTNHYGKNDLEYKTWYEPKFFYPPLNFFVIPEDTPENVKNTLIKSFALFFTNKSAANQIRIALEDLLTHMGIAKYNTDRKRLALHKRIELLEEEYLSIKDLCMAIKWLGNDGSHSGEKLINDDILMYMI